MHTETAAPLMQSSFNDVTNFTSLMRSVMQVVVGFFFLQLLVTQNVGRIRAKITVMKSCLNCQKLWPKCGQSVFPDTVYDMQILLSIIVLRNAADADA